RLVPLPGLDQAPGSRAPAISRRHRRNAGMTWEADMLWEERLQRQAEMLSNTAQGLPVPQESKSPPKKASWPADKVERRKVQDLVPYAKNARTHSEEQIEQIAHAIEQWGWTVPC